MRRSRRNPLASYKTPDRKLRGEFDRSQWYLFSKVAPETFERVFRRWPIPVRIKVMDPDAVVGTTAWKLFTKNEIEQHPDSCTILISQQQVDFIRYKRFDAERESRWSPFTLMHRIYDELEYIGHINKTTYLSDDFYTANRGVLIFEDSEPLQRLFLMDTSKPLFPRRDKFTDRVGEILRENRSFSKGYTESLLKVDPTGERLEELRSARSFNKMIPDIRSMGVNTATGRKTLFSYDQVESDVFAAWILYRKWVVQTKPPYRLTPDQIQYIRERIASMYSPPPTESQMKWVVSAIHEVADSKEYIEWKAAATKNLKERVKLVADMIQNYACVLVV